uniref:Uncharacterized protein n=1 Tax=Candidatus Kentrum sp. LFY TaxID=2126342 RepID=A0A450WNK8_9GAMM|nr:MAG: hypothetical protein BECKLFY1418C_GA0070996_104520 [Candidatus Kentron sp. LFY]
MNEEEDFECLESLFFRYVKSFAWVSNWAHKFFRSAPNDISFVISVAIIGSANKQIE